MAKAVIGTTTTADLLVVEGLRDLSPVLDRLSGSVLIVGGLMVRAWLHAHPIGLPVRATADIDLGVDKRRLQLRASSSVVAPLLQQHGFDPARTDGGGPFRFSKTLSNGELLVDLLVAPGASRSDPPLLEKGITSVAAPGLAYALTRGPCALTCEFVAKRGSEVAKFDLPLAHLDAAFVMKAELSRSGQRVRADRRRADTVDAVMLAAACLESDDAVETLRKNGTRRDVGRAVAWLRTSFRDARTAEARRVERHFQDELGRTGMSEWAVDVAARFDRLFES